MKPFLSKAADTLRDQINGAFVGRSRKADGWIGDHKHASRKSDHNPRSNGEVCAIDIDAGLSDQQGISYDLAEAHPYFIQAKSNWRKVRHPTTER